MLSLGTFLCIIFVLYSTKTFNHLFKGIDWYFYSSYSFSYVIWILYYLVLWIPFIVGPWIYMDISYTPQISLLKCRYTAWNMYSELFNLSTWYSGFLVVYVIIFLIARLYYYHPKIPSSLPKFIFLEPYIALINPNCNNYKPYLPRQMNKIQTLI